MICSLGLQLKYIRFKKKSFPTVGEVLKTRKYSFFWISKISIIHEKEEYEANLFEFRAKDQVGTKIEIMYVPQDITFSDKSVLISKILKRLNLYLFDRPTVLKKEQSPTPFYLLILIFGFFISHIYSF